MHAHYPEGEQPEPQQKDPYDEFEERMRRIGMRIHDSWRRLCQEWHKLDFDKRLAHFIQGALLLALIVYTVYTIKMYSANRESADAATRAAKTGEDALKIAYRPWINAESADLMQPLTFPPKFFLKLKFVLKNTGTSVSTDGVTIAYVVPGGTHEALNSYGTVCDQVDRSKEPVEKNMRPRATGFVLAPGNTLPFPVGMGSTISIQDAIDGKFFVFGCILYRDQFTTWHHTKFCFRPSAQVYDPTAKITDPKVIPFTICDTFQEAD